VIHRDIIADAIVNEDLDGVFDGRASRWQAQKILLEGQLEGVLALRLRGVELDAFRAISSLTQIRIKRLQLHLVDQLHVQLVRPRACYSDLFAHCDPASELHRLVIGARFAQRGEPVADD